MQGLSQFESDGRNAPSTLPPALPEGSLKQAPSHSPVGSCRQPHSPSTNKGTGYHTAAPALQFTLHSHREAFQGEHQQPDSPEAGQEAVGDLVGLTCLPHAPSGAFLHVNLQAGILRVFGELKDFTDTYCPSGTVLRAKGPGMVFCIMQIIF